ncbi:chromatin disassembly [Rhizoctonia solani]|uniref:Chromatin disassembly n=1 Tax=Rhizoctonia solani TaxID=456999 RepID=A0A8H7LJL1_9AGAM|nr:chromatin disassembly [Rhizoctonia solani]
MGRPERRSVESPSFGRSRFGNITCADFSNMDCGACSRKQQSIAGIAGRYNIKLPISTPLSTSVSATMSENIEAVLQSESLQPKSEAGASRSRVYIAFARERSNAVENSRSVETVPVLRFLVIMMRSPSAGPDKKPGTRTRTRKNTGGGSVAASSRTASLLIDPPLVPSQVGPERTKKRTKLPFVPSSDPLPSYAAPHPTSLLHSDKSDTTGSIPKISPPTLPGELGPHVAGNVARVRVGPNPTLDSNRTPCASNQLSDLLASNSIPSAHNTLDAVSGSSAWDHSIRQGNSGYAYGDDAYTYPSGLVVSEEPLMSSDATHSTLDTRLVQSSEPQPHYVLANISTTHPTSGTDPGTISLNTTDVIGVPPSLSVNHPTPPSPTFSRLHHAHDPHFRPPQDVFAGLTYPRDGIAIPTLGRGTRLNSVSQTEPPNPDVDERNDAIRASGHFHTRDEYEKAGQMVTLVSGDGMRFPHLRHSSVSDSSHGYESSSELGYSASTESVCSDHSNSTRISSRYRQDSVSNVTTPVSHYGYQDSAGYSSHTESLYSPSGYTSQNDGYTSDAQTPAEVTVLPPPANPGLLDFWHDGTNYFSQHANSVGGSGHTSIPGSISNPETGSTYHESTTTEDEDRGQVVVHHNVGNDLARNFYSTDRYVYGASWVSEPSVAFARKTWWDNLLETYAPTRTEAALQITSDLKYLFKTSNYWLSFLNINLFMTNYNHKERRENIQPALILAALAYSTFTQSSEIERGQAGRAKAMELRAQAQSALDASLNSQRLDPTLAQAAWLLALFEVSAHPEHSTERSRSALMFLDGIIRLLGLTMLDAMDPQTAVFSADRVPMLPLSQRRDASTSAGKLIGAPQAPSTGTATCACRALSIMNTTTHGQLTPFWVSSAGWNPNWNEAEIRREESRRLVWSALTLAAGFTAHDAAFAKDPTELHIIDAANYALCFPAEVMIRQSPSLVHSPQESVWALYGRAMLLWNSCLMLRKKSAQMTDAQRAEFAVNVWLETNTIEEALNRHTCSFEQNSLFQGREYLFNTRMFISWEFRRYIPSPDTEVHQQFHRRKAEEWLRHQAEVAKRLMQGLHTVTGLASNVLGKRPYFVWWFMSQVSRCLSLWQCDQSLFIALEVARAFLPPIDYLTCLWPCQIQRVRYNQIRQRLHNECVKYGLEPPPPPQLVIPTAIL